ncbi:MAG: leucine-rich repeat domain-containing protein [Firmicutes bacterium]|nr:leucine-rich repeat domain-containing protein [Bacillota bacterium]
MRIKNKRLFSVIAIIILALSIALVVSMLVMQTSVSAQSEVEDTRDTYYQNVLRSVQHFGNLMNNLSHGAMGIQSNSHSNTVSINENNFAGAFIDENGILNVGVVGLNDKTFRDDGQVVYRPQSFSWNCLVEIQERVMNTTTYFGVFRSGTDEERNHVQVYLTCESFVDELKTYLNIENPEILYFVVEESAGSFFASRRAYGGSQIDDRNPAGTITANARCNVHGTYGVLTNQHVALGQIMYQNGHRIGRARPGHIGGSVDAAFIPFENQNNWTPTAFARHGGTTFADIRIGTEDLIVQGLPVKRIGITTGITTGTITNRIWSATIWDDNSRVYRTFNNVIRFSDVFERGDSGGPLYFNAGNQGLFLIGMNFAGTTQTCPNTGALLPAGISSRISEVERILNVTVVTNGTIFNTTNIGNDEIRINGLHLTWPTIVPNPEDPMQPSYSLPIPDRINGRRVTQIGNSAFANQSNIITIRLPHYLQSIGYRAFERTQNLQSITIPQNVTHIGNHAFWMSGISSVTFENGSRLQSIGNNAFLSNSNLTSVTIPQSVTHIGERAFCSNQRLHTVVFENGSQIRNIGFRVFSSNPNLRNITIPEGVTHIETWAFAFSGLESITFPNTLTHIANEAFRGANLTNFTIPQSVAFVGNGVFWDIPNLSLHWDYNPYLDSTNFRHLLNSVHIPDGVQRISAGAFDGATRLTNIIGGIPRTVVYVGVNAFRDVSNLSLHWDYNYRLDSTQFRHLLTSVYIPNGTPRISDRAFDGAAGLTSITGGVPQSVTSIGYRAFADTQVEWIMLPNSLTHIGGSAFLGTRLWNITIPASVTYIGDYAFAGIYREFQSMGITVQSSIPPAINQTTFQNTRINFAGFNIPTGSYQNFIDAGWGIFFFDLVELGGNIGLFPRRLLFGEIRIPETINGQPVVSIGNNAFQGFWGENITRLTLPVTVETIGFNAFQGWTFNQVIFLEGRHSIPESFAQGWSGEATVEFELVRSVHTVTLISSGVANSSVTFSFVSYSRTEYSLLAIAQMFNGQSLEATGQFFEGRNNFEVISVSFGQFGGTEIIRLHTFGFASRTYQIPQQVIIYEYNIVPYAFVLRPVYFLHSVNVRISQGLIFIPLLSRPPPPIFPPVNPDVVTGTIEFVSRSSRQYTPAELFSKFRGQIISLNNGWLTNDGLVASMVNFLSFGESSIAAMHNLVMRSYFSSPNMQFLSYSIEGLWWWQP